MDISSQETFLVWNDKKYSIHTQEKFIQFKERDILFISVGLNIGYEQFGKGSDFLRPVLVYKKFNKRTFLGIPLSTKIKKRIILFFFYL